MHPSEWHRGPLRLLVGAGWLIAIASLVSAAITIPTIPGKVVGVAYCVFMGAMFLRPFRRLWARWHLENP